MDAQSSFNVRLMKRKRTNKKRLVKIEVEVMKYGFNGKDKVRRFVDTSVWINPNHWIQKTQKISSKEEDVAIKQQKINAIYGAILNFVNTNGEQLPDNDEIDVSNLKTFFPNLKSKKKTLVEYIDEYHKFRVGRRDKRNTTKGFVTLKSRISGFDKSLKQKTYFNSINLSWSNNFEIYLNGKNYKSETIAKTYSLLITFLNHYYDLKDELNIDLTDKFKSNKFKRGSKSGNKANPLNMLQLLQLIKHEFDEEHLKKTKKMILLQCHTGIRYDDIKRLRPEHIDDNFLIFKPVKTERYKIEVEQPLNPYAYALLKEFDFNTESLDYENQTYNKNIKTVFNKMRETYPDLKYGTYTSHNFRDTFISLAVEAEINWKSIITWVGHKNYNIMDRYISISKEFNKKEMEKMHKIMIVQGKVVRYKEM